MGVSGGLDGHGPGLSVRSCSVFLFSCGVIPQENTKEIKKQTETVICLNRIVKQSYLIVISCLWCIELLGDGYLAVIGILTEF